MNLYKALIVLIAIILACSFIVLICWLIWHFDYQHKKKTCDLTSKSLTQCIDSNGSLVEPVCNKTYWYCPSNQSCNIADQQNLEYKCSKNDMKCIQNLITSEYEWQCYCGGSTDPSSAKCQTKYNAPSVQCLNNQWTCYCTEPLTDNIKSKCLEKKLEPVCINNQWGCKCGSSYALTTDDLTSTTSDQCSNHGSLLCSHSDNALKCFCGSSKNSNCDRSTTYPSCDENHKWNCITCTNNNNNNDCLISNQRSICETNGSMICKDFNLCNENYTTSCLPNGDKKDESKLFYLVGYTGFNALFRSMFHLKCVNFADDIGKCLAYAFGPSFMPNIYSTLENKNFLPSQCLNGQPGNNNIGLSNKLCSRKFCPKGTSLPNQLNDSNLYAGCIFPSSLLTNQLKEITSSFSYTNSLLTKKPISDLFSFDQSNNYGKTPCILIPVTSEDYTANNNSAIKYVLLPGITIIQSSTHIYDLNNWNEKTYNYSSLFYAITPRSFPIQQFHPYLLWRFVPLFPTYYQNNNNRNAYSNLINDKSYTYQSESEVDYLQPIGNSNALFFFLGHLSSFTMINTQNNYVPDKIQECQGGCSGGQENEDSCGGYKYPYETSTWNTGQFYMNVPFQNKVLNYKAFEMNYGQFFKTGSFPQNQNLKSAAIQNPGIIGYADQTNNGFTLYKSPYNVYFNASTIDICCNSKYCGAISDCSSLSDRTFQDYTSKTSGPTNYNNNICNPQHVNDGFDIISYHEKTSSDDINKNFFTYDTTISCGGQFLTSPFQDPTTHENSNCPQRQNAIYIPNMTAGAAANLYYDGHSTVFNIMNLTVGPSESDSNKPSLSSVEFFQNINQFSDIKIPFVNYHNDYQTEEKEEEEEEEMIHFKLYLRNPNNTLVAPIQYALTPTIKQLTCFLETYTWNADFSDWIALGNLYYWSGSQEVTIRKEKTEYDTNLQNYLWILSQIDFEGKSNYNQDQLFGNQKANYQNYDLGTISSDGSSIYRWSFAIQIKSSINNILYYLCPCNSVDQSFVYFDFGSLKITETITIKNPDLFIKPLFLSTEESTGPTAIFDANKVFVQHFVHPSGSIYCEINSERYYLCTLFCIDSTNPLYQKNKKNEKNVFLLTSSDSNKDIKKVLSYINLQKIAEFTNNHQTSLEQAKSYLFEYKNYFIHFECVMFNLNFPINQNVCAL